MVPATRRLISSGSAFEREIGYSRAVVEGGWVFVSGTTGYDYATMEIAPDVEAQCEQTLKNVSSALAQAGASLQDVVRVLYIVPTPKDWPRCWPILRHYFGEVRPASTLIHAALQERAMRIEIEVTARLPGAR